MLTTQLIRTEIPHLWKPNTYYHLQIKPLKNHITREIRHILKLHLVLRKQNICLGLQQLLAGPYLQLINSVHILLQYLRETNQSHSSWKSDNHSTKKFYFTKITDPCPCPQESAISPCPQAVCLHSKLTSRKVHEGKSLQPSVRTGQLQVSLVQDRASMDVGCRGYIHTSAITTNITITTMHRSRPLK